MLGANCCYHGYGFGAVDLAFFFFEIALVSIKKKIGKNILPHIYCTLCIYCLNNKCPNYFFAFPRASDTGKETLNPGVSTNQRDASCRWYEQLPQVCPHLL